MLYRLLLLISFIIVSQLSFGQNFLGKTINVSETGELDQKIKKYTIFEIDTQNLNAYLKNAPAKSTQSLDLHIEGGISWNLELEAYDLLSKNYKLIVKGEEGIKEMSGSGVQTFQGSLKNGVGQVALTVNENFLYGYIKLSNESFFIEPLNYLQKGAKSNQFVTYRVSDLIPEQEHHCAWSELEDHKGEAEINSTHHSKNTTECYIINLAIASDYDMWDRYGNIANVENHNIGVMNNVQLDYRSEFAANLEYIITGQFIETTDVNTFANTTDASALLTDFADWASNDASGFTQTNVPYDRTQLWITRDIVFNGNASTIGLANKPGAYQILEDYSTSANGLRGLTSHELGHNYSINHDGSGGFIMSPSNSGSSIWSASSVSQFDTYMASFSNGLFDCSDESSPTANFVAGSSLGCTNSSISYKDNSRYGATRDWTFTGGTPVSSTNAKEDVIYTNTGTYGASIQSSNASGSSTFSNNNVITIVEDPGGDCIPTGAGGGGGITIIQLETISNTTANSTGTKYEDFYCSHITELEANSTYNFLINFEGANQNIAFWIDYNNDNTFTSNERQFFSASAGAGFYSIPFTTPATPPVYNQILRLRASTDVNHNGTACHEPTVGQMEDYGVYFRSTTVTVPIELISFSGDQLKDYITIDWQTSLEIDNDYFILEHSLDSEQFTALGKVKGTGSREQVTNYNYEHFTPSNGLNYYRLMQIDMDGKVTSSEVIAVYFAGSNTNKIYPNPIADNVFTLNYDSSVDGTLQVEILDLAGKILINNNLAVTKGLNTPQIVLPQLSAGTYFCRIKHNEQIETLRFVKM